MAQVAGLYCEVLGPPDGEPVILSAGLGGSAEYWRPNLAALTQRYRVILYDHRGTARSDRALPPGHGVDEMAEDVLTIMDALEVERAHLIGHALGGLIGLALALKAPGRLKTLVAINAWATLDPHTARCFDTRLSLLRDSGVEAFLRAQPIFLYPAAWISDHSARLDADQAAHLSGFAGVSNTEARIAAVRAFDLSTRLKALATPVLSLAAQDDILTPWTAARRLAESLSHGRFVAMPRGGHACNVTEPETFNRIVLAWLNGDPLPERS